MKGCIQIQCVFLEFVDKIIDLKDWYICLNTIIKNNKNINPVTAYIIFKYLRVD